MSVNEDHYTSMETLDATGIQFQANNTDGTSGGTIVDPQGITYGVSGTLTSPADTEDANGNKITATSTGWTDTLGRNIPSPYLSLSSASTSGCPSATTSAGTWNLPGQSGGSVPIVICSGTFTFSTQYNDPATLDGSQQGIIAITAILLPNGTSWQFTYDSWGNLTSVALPSGATISYTWVTPSRTNFGDTRSIASRVVNANNGSPATTWNYQWAVSLSGGCANIQTDPLGNDLVEYTGNPDGTIFCGAGYDIRRQYFQGANSAGTLLKTVDTSYSFLTNPDSSEGYGTTGWINLFPSLVKTTIPTSGSNTVVTQTQSTYDSGHTYFWLNFKNSVNNTPTPPLVYGSKVRQDDYDFGSNAPGALLRSTLTNYLWQSNSAYLTNNLLTPISSQQILDGGGTQRGLTSFGYDASTPASSGISTQHDSSPPNGNVRGNQTTVGHWLNTTGAPLTTTATFFDTGKVQTTTDPLLNKTTFAYSSTYAGAYLTSVTNALNQSITNAYDFNTGELSSTTDRNSQTTSYSYDSLWRLASVTYPPQIVNGTSINGLTTIARQESSFPFSETITKKINSSQNLVTTNVFDGLGRVTQNQQSDPQGTDLKNTTYDASGRVATVTNPYRSTNDLTYGLTSSSYDAIGRITQVTEADGSAVKTAYCGNVTLVTDEAGNWRRTTTDGLGRLIEVDEPNSSTASVGACPASGDPIQVTTYGYDSLNDLMSVVQNGSRSRSFSYDSLKRLTSATNPESGTITNTYDANSNVHTRVAPAPNQTGTSTVTTTYNHDALNRLTSKTFSDGTTPSVTFGYDGNVPSGCTPQALTITNGIGRQTAMCDGAGSESWSYDSMGRTLVDQRTTNGTTKSTTFTYNLDGSATTLAYPGGDTITYTEDSAGRPSVAQDVVNNITYASGSCASGVSTNGACYSPFGAPTQFQNGSSIVSTFLYNKRLQPCWIYATTGTPLATSTACTAVESTVGNVIDMQYNFGLGSGDNGNVLGINNNRVPTRGQTYTYDQLNRVATAQTVGTFSTDSTNCHGNNFGYDAWGNLLTIGVASSAYNGCNQESLSQSATANNQIMGECYDAAGNTTGSGTCPASSFVYNAENQLISAGGVTYTYDGQGRRVEKSNGTLFWYGDGRDPLVQTDLTGKFQSEYIFFGGKRIARRSSFPAVAYYFSDHLGSASVVTQANGTISDDIDYYPFGHERIAKASSGNTYTFTGKFLDGETGFYDFDARFYGPSQGRFMSPDPDGIGSLNSDPQSWNMYTYARNNPLKYIDQDGESYQICTADDKGNTQCTTVSDEQFDQAQQNPGSGITLSNGDIYVTDANGNQVKAGTYNQIDVDLSPFARGALGGAYQRSARALGYMNAAFDYMMAGLLSAGVADAVVPFAPEPPPSFGGGEYGVASNIPSLNGMSREDADAALRQQSPTKVHTTTGGYKQYKFADGSQIWIRPDGEIVRVPAPGTAPAGSRIGPDGDLTSSHSTGERLRD
jgi:RHS repeat-associated protein